MRGIVAWCVRGALVVAPMLGLGAQAASSDEIGPVRSAVAIAPMLGGVIDQEMLAKRIPGLSIALVSGGEVVWARGFGVRDTRDSARAGAHTAYAIGDASSIFTTLALLQLAERNRDLMLGAPVTRYLSGFAPRNPFGGAITVQELLAHRAGLVREPPVGGSTDTMPRTLSDAVRSVNATTLVRRPGSGWKYSSAGLLVAAAVAEHAAGMAYEQYVREHLARDLHLTGTGFAPDSSPAFAAGTIRTRDGRSLGASPRRGPAPTRMYSTVSDLGQVVAALLARRGDSSATTTWSSTDAGFTTRVTAVPKANVAVVVAASVGGVDAATERIVSQALAAMLRHGAASIPADVPARWRGLIGEYGTDANTYYLIERDGHLAAVVDWLYEYPLTELGPDRFAMPDSGRYAGEPLIVRRDASGRATQLTLGGTVLARRNLQGEDGSTFRITPLAPPASLRRIALASTPPVERDDFLPSDLVELVRLDSTIKLDIRYASTNNFLGTPLYSQARAFLQRPAAEALVRAHRALAKEGYGLLIHDGYRPWYVTKMFWDATPDDKKIFVADPSRGSRHNRGAAVDLTLYELATGRPVVMTGGYDEMSERSYPDYPGGTSRQRWLRELLRRAMEAQGFQVYEAEWWHFDYGEWRRYPIGNARFEDLGLR